MPIQPLLIHQNRSFVHSALPRLTRSHTLMPCLQVGKALELVFRCTLQQCVGPVIPGREGQVRVCQFIAYEPLAALEPLVKHTLDALHLSLVPLDRGRELLCVEDIEPAGLAEVGSLAAHLKVYWKCARSRQVR